LLVIARSEATRQSSTIPSARFAPTLLTESHPAPHNPPFQSLIAAPILYTALALPVSRASNSLREKTIPLALLAGDTVITFAGLVLGWWLRYESPIGRLGIDVPDPSLGRYLPLLLVGVGLLLAAFAQSGLYDARILLRRYQSLNAIIKGTAFWLLAYLGISLVLKFDPPISRLFAFISFACVVVLLFVWRSFAYSVVVNTPLIGKLRRRVALLGWNDDARSLAETISGDPAHPFQFVGIIGLPDDAAEVGVATSPNRLDSTSAYSGSAHRPASSKTSGTAVLADVQPQRENPYLGDVDELNEILKRESVDLLIATRFDLPRQQLRAVVETCERHYVEWKIVPGAFDIFLSGLRLQTIGRVPVLGIEELSVNRLFSRTLKRAVDVIGGAVGLLLSLPFIVVIAALIKRESPSGPIFFLQQRVGAGHRPFTVVKLRSMTPDAAATDADNQSTQRNDPRLLNLGGFIRRWNLDELPQFWNVLRGDMSLVGPRPERPHHVDRLALDIAHYLPRHVVKPGMTGWAQIHGLRGDTDLAARVQHDIYYIENWSIWLDVQIMLLTFVRWKGPSGSLSKL
jgi:lipopolysaccharide/colanic/teichoic acid biosynthesis glycosyltransferase